MKILMILAMIPFAALGLRMIAEFFGGMLAGALQYNLEQAELAKRNAAKAPATPPKADPLMDLIASYEAEKAGKK